MDISISQGKSVNKPYTPSFNGNLAAKAYELVGGDGVFKNCRRLDVETLRSYIGSLPFKMGITTDDVAALSKFDGVEFLEQSYIFLCKKMGIPDELRPLAICGKINGDAVLGYQPMVNNVRIDVEKLNVLALNKNNIFSSIRHELQHAMQYYSILRHEELGPKAIEVAGDIFADNLKVGAQELLKNTPVEEAEKYCLDLNDQVSYEAIQFVKKRRP